MFDRKRAKAAARSTLKRHYWMLVFLCFIAAFAGIKYDSAVVAVNSEVSTEDAAEEASAAAASDSGGILYEFISGNIGISIEGEDVLDNMDEAEKKFKDNKNKSFKVGSVEFSFADGEFAKLANMAVTGSYVSTIYKGVVSITGSKRAAAVIMIIASVLIRLFLTYFVFNVLSVVMSRIFLEARTFEKVPVKSFFMLIRTKKWLRAGLTLLLRELYQGLWNLTVIGGIIKHFSYYLVPYLIAENPDLRPNEAITLSRKLMKGHKWECFKLELSFLGWEIIGMLTAGLLNIFWINPYKEAAAAELYASLRAGALSGEKRSAVFIDRFLFEKASADRLASAYGDIDALKRETEQFTDRYTGAKAFFANVFGIVPRYTERTEAIDRNEINKIKVSQYLDELEGRSYPERLSPTPPSPKRDRLGTVYYTRSYSIVSIIMMFFIGCAIGWTWEVIYKYIEVGKLVNRGVLHGPWLPIYGAGAVMILLALKRFRHKPIVEFFAAIVLCGIVEYFTAAILEATHDGQKWWDYSGYFLNINGRVCAEGLMVFGIGGVAFVYFAAPMLDNYLRKLKMRYAVPICAALLIAFAADTVYSHFYPNQGTGITDYQSAQVIQQL